MFGHRELVENPIPQTCSPENLVRRLVLISCLLLPAAGLAQKATDALPDDPSSVLYPATDTVQGQFSSSIAPPELYAYNVYPAGYDPRISDVQNGIPTGAPQNGDPKEKATQKSTNPVELDKNGEPIALERKQPQRILGFMPNFRSVSGGAVAHPPGWKYNFKVATRQSFDYSSFIFLGITSLSAEGLNSHPVLGKGVHGFYSYTWRGLIDKTDGTYLQAWLLPSLLHEDTRYYALGHGSILHRALYVISRQAITRTYGGRDTLNIAGLGGKVLTQTISRYYYPPGATSFGVLATKFGYSSMRDVGFTSVREFYPDIAAHYIRKHREKQARLLQQQQLQQHPSQP